MRSIATQAVELPNPNGRQLPNLRSSAMHGRLTPPEAVIPERTTPETRLPNSIRTAIDISQASHLQNLFKTISSTLQRRLANSYLKPLLTFHFGSVTPVTFG